MTAERGRTKARQAPGSMPRRPLGSSDGPGADDAIRAVEELVQGDVVHRAVENCFDLVQQPFAGNEASRTTRERLRREEGLREVRLQSPGASDAVTPIRIEVGCAGIPPTVVAAQLAEQRARLCRHPAMPLAHQLRDGEP